ncbi:hypothetical protein GCM10022198_04650 [Klugiella xanthotipulae]
MTLRLDQEVPGQLGTFALRLADAGINILVQYSDHDHRLIVVVAPEQYAQCRQIAANWDAEREARYSSRGRALAEPTLGGGAGTRVLCEAPEAGGTIIDSPGYHGIPRIGREVSLLVAAGVRQEYCCQGTPLTVRAGTLGEQALNT